MNWLAEYQEIPRDARDVLDEIYEPEGVAMFWRARNRVFDSRPVSEVYAEDPKRVLGWLNALADGNF